MQWFSTCGRRTTSGTGVGGTGVNKEDVFSVNHSHAVRQP